jgi:hypothetical protein
MTNSKSKNLAGHRNGVNANQPLGTLQKISIITCMIGRWEIFTMKCLIGSKYPETIFNFSEP